MNGGARPGAGRKPKATEIELIEKLGPMEATAFEKLEIGVKSGEFAFIKLYMEYRFGKPKQIIDMTTDGESLNKTATVILPGGVQLDL
jgi:hypothetical protein